MLFVSRRNKFATRHVSEGFRRALAYARVVIAVNNVIVRLGMRLVKRRLYHFPAPVVNSFIALSSIRSRDCVNRAENRPFPHWHATCNSQKPRTVYSVGCRGTGFLLHASPLRAQFPQCILILPPRRKTCSFVLLNWCSEYWRQVSWPERPQRRSAHSYHWRRRAGVTITPTITIMDTTTGTTMALARPWYVNPVPVVYSAGLPPVEIRLANPNQVALNYTLDGGPVQTLPAGQAVTLNQDAVIAFDRGGAQGWNRFTLTSGAYKFIPAAGAWSLVRDVSDSTVVTAASPISPAANPLPPATP